MFVARTEGHSVSRGYALASAVEKGIAEFLTAASLETLFLQILALAPPSPSCNSYKFNSLCLKKGLSCLRWLSFGSQWNQTWGATSSSQVLLPSWQPQSFHTPFPLVFLWSGDGIWARPGSLLAVGWLCFILPLPAPLPSAGLLPNHEVCGEGVPLLFPRSILLKPSQQGLPLPGSQPGFLHCCEIKHLQRLGLMPCSPPVLGEIIRKCAGFTKGIIVYIVSEFLLPQYSLNICVLGFTPLVMGPSLSPCQTRVGSCWSLGHTYLPDFMGVLSTEPAWSSMPLMMPHHLHLLRLFLCNWWSLGPMIFH